MQVDVRDVGSITGSGRSPGGGHSNPLQYSDRGAWWAMVHRVAEVLGPGTVNIADKHVVTEC